MGSAKIKGAKVSGMSVVKLTELANNKSDSKVSHKARVELKKRGATVSLDVKLAKLSDERLEKVEARTEELIASEVVVAQ